MGSFQRATERQAWQGWGRGLVVELSAPTYSPWHATWGVAGRQPSVTPLWAPCQRNHSGRPGAQAARQGNDTLGTVSPNTSYYHPRACMLTASSSFHWAYLQANAQPLQMLSELGQRRG